MIGDLVTEINIHKMNQLTKLDSYTKDCYCLLKVVINYFENCFKFLTIYLKDHRAMPEKNQTGRRGWRQFLKKDPWNFLICHFTPWKFQTKWSFIPWKFHKIVLHPLEFPRPKVETHGIPRDFFWITPVNSTSFCRYWPQEFLHSIYSVPLTENSMSTPLFWFFLE